MLPSQRQGKKQVLYGVWELDIDRKLYMYGWVGYWRVFRNVKYYYLYLDVYYLADLFVVFFAAKKDSFFLRLMKLRKQINQDPILSSAMERAEHK